MMNIRGVRALQAVAEHGTVTGAAAALNFTPSALSQQIGQLSTELGADLLERHGRGVELTPAAHLLLGRAQQMNAFWEVTRAQVAGSSGAYGQLRFCGVSSVIAAYIAPAVTRLKASYEGIDPWIREEESADCYRLLATEKADIAVVLPTPEAPPHTDARFDQQPLAHDPQDLLVPQGHPLARDEVKLSEAASETWIAKRHDNDTHARTHS